MKKIVFSCIAFCLAGCGEPSNTEPSEAMKIELNKVLLNIPPKYVLSELPSAVAPSKGLDSGGGVSLKIPFGDLGMSQDGDLIVLLSKPSEYVKKFGVSIDAYNAWNGLELYADRVVERDSDAGLFRVGAEAAYPMFWHYFTAPPSNEVQPRETWVASCYEATKGRPTCSMQFVFDEMESKLAISGALIGSMNSIEEAYRKQLASWIKSDEADPD